jgi:hypothetical protein
MDAATVVIPPDLAARLEAAAGAIPGEKDRLVREALETFLDERTAPTVRRKTPPPLNLEPFPDGQTLGDVMKDVCGKYEGPGDLSYNPKYMEGFGEE